MNQSEGKREDLVGILISQLSQNFGENKQNPLSRYFYLYFLHLLGKLNYREEDGMAVFFAQDYHFSVPLPIIDSEENYREIEKTNSDLQTLFSDLKEKMAEPPLNFIQDL